MPNVLPTLISVTKAYQRVHDLCSGRVYADFIPEGSAKPAAILFSTYEEPFDCLVEFMPISIATVRFEAYGETREEANDLSEAIEQSLRGYTGQLAGDDVFINGVSRQTGQIHLVDIPHDGTDNWQFRTAQSFEVSYTKRI